jgi:hypothetical protein
MHPVATVSVSPLRLAIRISSLPILITNCRVAGNMLASSTTIVVAPALMPPLRCASTDASNAMSRLSACGAVG